jgi:quinolinate synthase
MTETLTIQGAASFDETLALMRTKLERVMPPAEIELKADYAFRINQLKRQMNAVILGHNYMEPALYCSVPDYVGDSLELSRVSAETEADIIVFCGVQFMAETAKILNPDKTVLIPSQKAGCSLAAGITPGDIIRLREQYPDAVVVTYVNTYAAAKAESDYSCTSGNAAKMVRHLIADGHRQVLLLPDEFLARNTAHELSVPYVQASADNAPAAPETAIIGWTARCEVHDQFRAEDVINARKQFPNVTVLAHPECRPEVTEISDMVGSTKQILEYVETHDSDELLLLTECAMGDNVAAEHPEKEILRMCSVRCPHMNQITLEDTLAALEYRQYAVELPEDIIKRARTPIDRMLAVR